MVYSMTGIGSANGAIRNPNVKFEVAIKSYNHRFLEISVKCPNCLAAYEEEIRHEVQKKVSRGHIIVLIQQDREFAPSAIEIDRSMLEAYLRIVKELKRNRRITGELNINTLLSIPGLVKFSQKSCAEIEIYKKFKPILDRAIVSFLNMKTMEGRNIVREISKSIRIIENAMRKIEVLVPARNEEYRAKLTELVGQYKEGFNHDRLHQELLYLTDRGDITEECKRIDSHIKLFKDALSREDNPGRRIVFLLQEMQREANTLSVKANMFEISRLVVKIKEEIERIREQSQNIE